MMILAIMAGWALCSAAAFVLFCFPWRSHSDVTIGDAVFFAILSIAGPLSLAAAIIIVGVEALAESSHNGRLSGVLWRRRQ